AAGGEVHGHAGGAEAVGAGGRARAGPGVARAAVRGARSGGVRAVIEGREGCPGLDVHVAVAATPRGAVRHQRIRRRELHVEARLRPFLALDAGHARDALLRVTEVAVAAGDVDVGVHDLIVRA